MVSRARVVLSFVTATIGGAATALMLAGPALFADGSEQERLVVVALAVFAEGLVAFGAGWLAPRWRTLLVAIVVAPTVVVALLILTREPQVFRTALLLVFGSVGFSIAGVLLAMRLAGRSRSAT